MAPQKDMCLPKTLFKKCVLVPMKKARDSAVLESRILGPHWDMISATLCEAGVSSLNRVLWKIRRILEGNRACWHVNSSVAFQDSYWLWYFDTVISNEIPNYNVRIAFMRPNDFFTIKNSKGEHRLHIFWLKLSGPIDQFKEILTW